ncbi:MAG: tetratricopeptide repeat protein [Betaproteobacteria bacterium PRO3]|nr:tetratricopeptide repeat protein [Betaproteobacteria bacterium PRO3]
MRVPSPPAGRSDHERPRTKDWPRCFRACLAAAPPSRSTSALRRSRSAAVGVISDLVKSLRGRTATSRATAEGSPSNPAAAGTAAGGAHRSTRGAALSRVLERTALHPDDAEAWGERASLLARQGRHREALDACRKAFALRPSSEAIAVALADSAIRVGRPDEAEAALREAVAKSPEATGAALALARHLAATGRAVEARAMASPEAASGGRRVDALFTLAACASALGDPREAERYLRAAIDAGPADPRLHRQLASALQAQGRDAEADDAMELARRLSGDADVPFDAVFVRAEQLRRAGRLSDQAALLVAELRERPSAAGQFMLSEALIAQGKFRSGWRQFEFRKFERAMRGERRNYGIPPWVGQPLSGRSVLVQAEQGVGDVVWFARYFPLLERLGARVVFLPRADMQRMSWRFDGVDHVLREGEALPPLDFHVNLMTLATRFRTTLRTIPADVPYLRAGPDDAQRWERRLAPAGRPRVGLVWAGRPDQPRNASRSLQLSQLLPILRVRGVEFCSLQKGPSEAQIGELPADVSLVPLGASFEDLDDLVAAMSRMDLVISVCTGPAHIAGAMGLPVWAMICDPPDMRWLTGRDDSPWYPTMRLFRQRVSGEWSDVVERVAAELARAGSNLSSRPPGIAAPPEVASESSDDASDRGIAQLVETPFGSLMMDVDADALEHVALAASSPTPELERLLALAQPADVIAVLGAGAGLEAVAAGRRIGRSGHLFAHEPDARLRAMLVHNLAANEIGNATVLEGPMRGAGDGTNDPGADGVDDLWLERLDGIFANAGAAAGAVLEGAIDTIWRCRPWLVLACSDEGLLNRVAERLRGCSYRVWRSGPGVAAPDVERTDRANAAIRPALWVVALPEESERHPPPAHCVELT